jgi:uncharacterized iron-regulated protein
MHLPTPNFLFTLLLTALLCGCAGPKPITALPLTDVPQRVQALLPVNVILLGEQHDNTDHHRIEHEVVQALIARQALAALVLEMANQGQSTAGSPASASESDIQKALAWDNKAWRWDAYSASIMAAVRAGVPVVGANLPRAALGEAMQQRSLDTTLPGPALKAQQQNIRIGHCNLLPESQITPMTRVQIARDMAMAQTISAASLAAPGKTVLLLAGAAHVDTQLGVPQHLPAGLTRQSILMTGDTPSEPSAGSHQHDVAWRTAKVAEKDYCEALRGRVK